MKQDRPSQKNDRRAILLHDDGKGLIESWVTYEDGSVRVIPYDPASPLTMAESIETAKHILVTQYHVPRDRIRTQIVSIPRRETPPSPSASSETGS